MLSQVLIRERQGEITHTEAEQTIWDGVRDWSDVVPSQGILATTRSWK